MGIIVIFIIVGQYIGNMSMARLSQKQSIPSVGYVFPYGETTYFIF